jgi:hypothetical protein
MSDIELTTKSEQSYASYFCEENIWRLCNHFPALGGNAVFISNVHRQCPMWYQSSAAEGAPVIWDYHVIFMFMSADTWRVVDHDTRLPNPINLDHYLSSSFPSRIAPDYEPVFRVVDSSLFLNRFSSSRSHMRNQSGNFTQPLPSWSPIYNGIDDNLDDFVDMKNLRFGTVYSKGQFIHIYCLS